MCRHYYLFYRLETMMKIHTTQNLSPSVANNSTNNIFAQSELSRFRLQGVLAYHSNEGLLQPSFKGKKPDSKQVKKIIESIKKAVGEVSEKAKPEIKSGDNLYRSPLFNKFLNVVDYETVVQASIAAVACTARAGTILAMSNEQNRENNTYAVSHALASGIVGFITVFLLTAPFKAGTDHVMKKMFNNLKESVLKRLHPQLDVKSIVDKEGKRIPQKIFVDKEGKEIPQELLKNFKNDEIFEKILWKDLEGNDFCAEIKNCDMLPQFKHISDISKETFEKILGVINVDWASQKGKSFNEVVTKDGKRLYDVIDFNSLGLKVSQLEKPVEKQRGFFGRIFHSLFGKKTPAEVKTEGQILFKDLDRSFIEDYIKNADDASVWKKLDLNTVYKDGQVQDFRKWKDLEGKNWTLDLDSVYVSSPLETFDYAPRITGQMRFDSAEGIHKFRTYQRNGKNGKIGSVISDEMLKADKESAGLIKSLTWLPDLVFRIPIALTTVSLIPWILKNCFNVEKKKPQVPVQLLQPVANAVAFKGKTEKPTTENSENTNANSNISFKGKGDKATKSIFDKMLDFVGKAMAELYGKRLIESEGMAKVSAKLADVPGGLTQAMATFGSLLTSSAYVYGTLANKNLDKDKRKTLAINQTLCFIVPTFAAYTVDRFINNWVKKNEYRFSGVQQGDAAALKLAGKAKEADEAIKSLGKKVKGVRALASLAVFTIIYRYATPVIITPVANKIGDWLNARSKAKKEEELKNVAKAVA